MDNTKRGGLLPLIKDERDIRVGAVFTLPPLSEIPVSFHVPVPDEWIYTQGEDTCAGCGTAMASSKQEGVQIGPLFPWIIARASKGIGIDDFGIDLRSIAIAHVKVGALEMKDEPYTGNEPKEVWRDITNWDISGLIKKSVYHKKGSFVFIEPTQGYDLFDTMRATVWKLRNENVLVMFGMNWAYGDISPIDQFNEGGEGHLVVFTGCNGDTIHGLIVNSWGLSVGEKGRFQISREIINKGAAQYGAAFFHDETPENLNWYIANGVKMDDTSWKTIINIFIKKTIELFKKLVANKQAELGAPVPSKWLIPAMCWQESDIQPWVTGDNGHAYGILQLWQSYIDDALPGYKTKDFLNNVPLSLICLKRYMARYATPKQIGRAVTDQDIARIHNGGPTGWKKEATLIYWWGVRTKIAKLENGTAPKWVYDRLKLYKLI
jgi:hypothetical protein